MWVFVLPSRTHSSPILRRLPLLGPGVPSAPRPTLLLRAGCTRPEVWPPPAGGPSPGLWGPMVCCCSCCFNLEGPVLPRGRGAAVSGKSGSCSPDLPTLRQAVARWVGDGGRGHHHGRLLLDVSGRERHAPWSVRSQPPSPSCSLESSLRPRAGPGDLGRRARLVGDRPGEEKSPTLCARPRLRGGPGWRGSEGEKGRRRVPGTGLGSSAPRQGGGRAVGHQGAWSTWGPPRAWLLGQESAAWRAAEQGSSSTGVPETAAFGSWPAEGPAATQRTPGVGLGTPRVASRTPLHQERAQSRSGREGQALAQWVNARGQTGGRPAWTQIPKGAPSPGGLARSGQPWATPGRGRHAVLP